MLTWIVLLVFGVPLVVILLKIRKQSKDRDQKLTNIQNRLKEKQQEEIDSRLETIKNKRKATIDK